MRGWSERWWTKQGRGWGGVMVDRVSMKKERGGRVSDGEQSNGGGIKNEWWCGRGKGRASGCGQSEGGGREGASVMVDRVSRRKKNRGEE